MLNSLPVAIIVGTLLGFLSGLGIGGGSLLIVWLTVILDITPPIARSVNLLFFLPSAAVVCFLRHKDGTLKIRPLLPAMIAGCIAAALFSWISANLETTLLKKLFGAVLIAAGIREVLYKNKEKGSSA